MGTALTLPDLDDGRVYARDEVVGYIATHTGSSDFDVFVLHFPRNLMTWEFDRCAWRDGKEVLLQYRIFPIAEFQEQIRSFETPFNKHEEHRIRIEEVAERLKTGRPLFPVLMQKNDPQRRICEGMHRSVAALHLGSTCLPAFLAGYVDWFSQD